MRLKITIGGIWSRQRASLREMRFAALASLLVLFYDLHAPVDIGADRRPGGGVLQLYKIFYGRLSRNFRHAKHRLIGILLLQPAEDGHRQVLLCVVTQGADEIAILIVFYLVENVVLFKINGVLFPLFRPYYLLGIGEGLFEGL